MPKIISRGIPSELGFCLVTPRNHLLIGSIRNNYIDCWAAHYSDERWVEQQRAGWKVVRVTISVSAEDPQSVSNVWESEPSKKKR